VTPEVQEEHEISFADYITVLRKRIYLFSVVFLLVTAGGLFYTFTVTPLYEAELKLEIMDMPEEGMELLHSLSGIQNDKVETEIEKIKSRDIARRVVENLSLNHDTEPVRGRPDVLFRGVHAPGASGNRPAVFFVRFLSRGRYRVEDAEGRPIGEETAESFATPEVSFTITRRHARPGEAVKLTVYDLERSVTRLLDRTDISRIGATSIIRIAVRHPFPRLAAGIAREFADVYAAENLRQKNASAREVNKFISRRRAYYNRKKQKALEELEDFKAAHNIFSLDAKNSALVDRIAELETVKALKQVELDRLDKALSLVESGDDGSVTPEIFAPQSGLEQLSAKLAMLTVLKKKLLNGLTPDHPRVKETEVQIKEIKAAIRRKIAATRKVVEAELDSIDKQIASCNKEVEKLPELDRNLVEKLRDVRFYEEMELQMAKKSEESAIVEVSTLSSVRITQRPVVPDTPVTPHTPINIVLTLVTALLAGLGIVFTREYFDRTFNSAEEIEEFLGEDVTVVIPYVRKHLSRDVYAVPREGLAYLSPDSPITEAFRTLKTAIEFSGANTGRRVYQISSAGAGEGKSIISSNLAITFANAGVKTLLIDADYKKPVLHKIFKCENRVGFIDMLYKGVSVRETLQHTDIEHLDLISSGIILDGTMQSIHYEKLVPLLDELKTMYEIIFFDTPPLLAIDDSIRIGRIVDGLIMVIALGKVDRRAVKRCMTRCRNTGISPAAIVANDCKKTERYTRSYNYYQYYPYASKKKDARPVEKKWRIYLKK